MLARVAISIALTYALAASSAFTMRQTQDAQANPARKQQSPPAAHSLRPNPIFDEILPELRQKTRVPLRLPAYVPFSERIPEDQLNKANGEENLYASFRASEQQYGIELAFGRNCEGAHVCRDGGLTGSTVFHDDYPDRPKVMVKLRGNIPATFVDSECGAYCDESVLYWSENGYHYSVSGKAAKKEELLKIANSAIEVAQAESQQAVHNQQDKKNSGKSAQEKAHP